MMYTLIGVIIGILINHLIIRPIERKYWRKKCLEDGLAKESEADDE